MQEISLFQTVVIAIVEGLTEFLPVSSTGHMIIAQSILGVESTEFIKTFTVVIQFGAILSVVFLYRKRFFRFNPLPLQGSPSAIRRFLHQFDFYYKLFLGFIPAACFGLLFHEKIDELLESVDVVAFMLFLGGFFMLFIDKIFPQKSSPVPITGRRAIGIGCFQCIAMIPGVSRSMATIVGGMALHLSRKAATEFSFFLAVPTMFAATGYKILKLLLSGDAAILYANAFTLLVGNLIAFIVALLAIKFFIKVVTKYGFSAFGWYRIFIGGSLLLINLMTA